MRKLFALLLLATGVASAGLPSAWGHMQISGILGGSDVPGREGTIEVLESDQSFEVPMDTALLTPAGKTRHGLVTFHKNFDKSSPILMARILSQTVIPNITVTWYEIDDTGTERPYVRYLYTNVRIVKFRPYLENANSPNFLTNTDKEEITFSYRAMSVTFLDGNMVSGGISSVPW